MPHQETPPSISAASVGMWLSIFFHLCVLNSCGHLTPEPASTLLPEKLPEVATTPESAKPALAPLSEEVTLQVGAFSQKERAEKYMDTLKSQGVDAVVSRSGNGFWAVRTGNFSTWELARDHGNTLKAQQKIDDFFVVEDNPVKQDTTNRLRDKILNTARRYLGTSYRWGGASQKWGVDCSGFTWVVFREHGIELPRNASQQYLAGEAVAKKDLKKGDLVFFATGRRSYVSHVGIYSGDDQFIHASVTDKRVRPSSLSNAYFKKHFIGARRLVKTP